MQLSAKTRPSEVGPSASEELRAALIRALAAGVAILPIVVVQWWMITPAEERRVTMRRLGLWQCSAGKWHFHGYPRLCLCRWPEGSRAETLEADYLEARRLARGGEKE